MKIQTTSRISYRLH